jgi:CRT10
MEHDTRRLQPVKIGMTSVETGRERFTRNEHFLLPQASSWRNNLTALSQRYNLYFVALETLIRVYQPRFPFQTLGEKPVLIIPPALAEPNAQGYIDSRQAHTINHMIVGDLGKEEILLVATDSGNVAAYHTKAIRDATEKDPYKYSTDARSDFVGVRAFFTHWVHESAWGLAIHKEARMIAVSANTPYYTPAQDDHAKITVFAFALTSQLGSDYKVGDNDPSRPLEQLEWKTCEPNPCEPWLSDRRHNYKTVLSDHIDNIPNISFVNSSHDRDGCWLVSTDIGGRMKLWHIWIRQCYKTWDFSIPENPAMALEDVVERGWLVLALDPASFRSVDSAEELCGSPRPMKYHKHTGTAESYDITNWVRTRVPNNSQLHPAFGAPDDDQEERDENDLDLMETYSSDDEHTDSESGGLRLGLEGENSFSNDNEETLEEGNAQIDKTVQAPEEEDQQLAEGFLPSQTNQALDLVPVAQASPLLETLPSPSEDELDLFDEDSSTDDEASMVPETDEGQSSLNWATVAQANGEYVFPEDIDTEQTTYLGPPRKKPRHSKSYKEVYEACMNAKAIRTSTGLQPIAPFPVIQCSTSHIRLITVPRAKTPHFFCASALKQTLPRTLERSPLVHMERLNMTQYIPDLGIVIIATQIGRCAVCTLTKKSDTGTTGFRVDWILPTKEQEAQDLRPRAPLLGIAAGPIQGRQIGEEDNNSSDDYDSSFKAQHRSASSSPGSEGSISSDGDPNQTRQRSRPLKRCRAPRLRLLSHPIPKAESWFGIENSRRYRLMLTYYDQSVLTYELWQEAPNIGIDGRKNWRNRPTGMV